MSNSQRAARIQALHDVGAKIDDSLDQIKIQTARRDGIRSGQSDVISHLISNCKDPALDKNTVQHCIKLVQQLQSQSNIMYYMTLGSEKQCIAHVAEIKKMYDLEVALKLREETLPTPEEIASRPAPARTIKEMRLAELALATNALKENTSEKPAQQVPQVIAPLPEANSKPDDAKQDSTENKKKKTVKTLPATSNTHVTSSDEGKLNIVSESSSPQPSTKKTIRKNKKSKTIS